MLAKCHTSTNYIFSPDLIHIYKWLTAYVLKMTAEKVSKLKAEGKSNFWAKNDSQSFNAVTLSVVYGEVSYKSIIFLQEKLQPKQK